MAVGSFGQGQKHAAMVFRIIDALNQAGFGQTIDQFDCGVMANTQPMREIPTVTGPPPGNPLIANRA